jgi:hypothetical protein
MEQAEWASHRQHSFTTAGQGRRAQRGAGYPLGVASDAVVQSAVPVTDFRDRYRRGWVSDLERI